MIKEITIHFVVVISLIISSMYAATFDDFRNMSQDEQILSLQNRPDKQFEDISTLFRVYNYSLSSEVELVRLAASQSSVFLVLGLQEAHAANSLEKLPIQEAESFKYHLINNLRDPNNEIRSASATALVYLIPPSDNIENLALSFIADEANETVASSVVAAMVQVGYENREFIETLIEALKNSEDPAFFHSASNSLGSIQAIDALPQLIEMASHNNLKQRDALQALAMYGAKAAKAVEMLRLIIKDPNTEDGIKNLALLVLRAIETNTPSDSNIKELKTTKLWTNVDQISSANDLNLKNVGNDQKNNASSTYQNEKDEKPSSTDSGKWLTKLVVSLLALAVIIILSILIKGRIIRKI